MWKTENRQSQTDLTWDYSDPVNGPTIPAPYSYDPTVFAQEKERIFMRCWHLVGHVNDFNDPGNYVVQDIFEQSVVVTTDKSDEIHAWHNVCRHRGNRLMINRRGKVGGFLSCQYHSWFYNLDGRLRAAPRT